MGMYRNNVRPWITEACYREAMSELEKAEAAVRNDRALLRRVRTAALSWEHVRILNWKDWNRGASEAERQAAIDRWVAELRERGVNTPCETIDPQAFEKYVSGLRRAP